MVPLESEEFDFFSSLLHVDLGPLLAARLQVCDADLEFEHSVLLAQLLLFQLFDLTLEVFFAMLSLQLLAHGKCNRALVQNLVRLVRLLDVVPHAHQQEPTFRLVERHLPDDFIEALREELLTHRTQTCLTRLPLMQLLVEHLAQAGDVDSRGGHVRHVLDEVLALLDPLSRGHDAVENVFSPDRFVLQGWQSRFFHRCHNAEQVSVTIVWCLTYS